MPYAPKDPKTNAAGCAERKPFSPADFFSTLLKCCAPCRAAGSGIAVAQHLRGSTVRYGPTSAECAGRISFLKVDPLRERQSILDVDTEIAHRAVHLRMAKQQLDRP